MRWERKAMIQRLFARTPLAGDAAYVAMQRRIGSLTPNPFLRADHHLVMLRLLRDESVDVDGARCLEVGTGHHPSMPLLFHLCGASEVLTVDLNRRLQWRDVTELMTRLDKSRGQLHDMYSAPGYVEAGALDARLDAMAAGADDPHSFFSRVGIAYLAPGDATGLDTIADGSIDVHFSSNVLEHIPPDVLAAIFAEARRILGPDGVAVHCVDPSDHYAQSDSRIPLMNFLQYSPDEWDRLAGNRFAFHNRLRGPDYLQLVRDAGFAVLDHQYSTDQRSLDEIADGFPLHADYVGRDRQELAITDVDFIVREA